jgi:hypothetical protein
MADTFLFGVSLLLSGLYSLNIGIIPKYLLTARRLFQAGEKKILKGQSSEMLIPFYDIQYMDRARPDKEPFLVLTFFRGPHDFR